MNKLFVKNKKKVFNKQVINNKLMNQRNQNRKHLEILKEISYRMKFFHKLFKNFVKVIQ